MSAVEDSAVTTVDRSASRALQPPPFLCAGFAVGGMPVTGVGSPAGELVPLVALVALFVGAGVWMFRRYRPDSEPELIPALIPELERALDLEPDLEPAGLPQSAAPREAEPVLV
ncbi:MAG: hypothetical protein M3N47_05730 [Chloroflexota bacterium]|nr:hypothetical protein [Chloroflexota bacterium]